MAAVVKWVDPGIVVKDVAKSTAWYVKMLGFKVEMAMPNAKQPAFTRLGNGSVSIMFSDGTDVFAAKPKVPAAVARALASKHAPHVVDFYLRVEDGIDALYRSVKRKGAEIERAPMDQPWGMRDFVMRDPDGFRVAVGQEIAHGHPHP